MLSGKSFTKPLLIATAPGHVTVSKQGGKAFTNWYDSSRMPNKPGYTTPAVIGGAVGVGGAAAWFRGASRAASSASEWAELNAPLLAEGLEMAPVFPL